MLRHGPAGCVAIVLLLGCAACSKDDLSTEQLSAVVDAKRPTLGACYDAALEKHPHKEEVQLEAVIHIEPSGGVSKVELDGENPLPGLDACLREAIGSWKFPKAPDATSTSLPLIFRPEVVQKPSDEVP
ncbi:MAG: AgmX/PglI C-terminal domain-containing protein [Myxococcales bacterium]|jgi:hypothetical protein